VSRLNRIQLLEKSVAELIAAGEVVERPASAVKELLENAVDAGATAVAVEIKSGGIAFIRVTDNGSGIYRDDLEKAFLRHATSKVRSAQDLEAIGTLGFRGEALASISAVSKVELLTRTAKEISGCRIELLGGEVTQQDDAGCPQGTTIIVRELFFNTPARMKFLKKDVSEANAVYAVVERIALSHPEISIKFIKDGHEALHTPGDNKLISAIHAALGHEFAKSLIPAEYELGGVRVTGFIIKPISARPNRNMQYFFLNGRLIKSKTAFAALEEGYKGSIMVGKFPGCVLHIQINPALVDVNVHPAKIEVRFANEKQVFDAVYYTVKNTLEGQDTRPNLNVTPSTAVKALSETFKEAAPQQISFSSTLPTYIKAQQESYEGIVESTARATYQTITSGNENLVQKAESAEALPLNTVKCIKEVESANALNEIANTEAINQTLGAQNFRIVGDCFNTYILVEIKNELLIIDKHAAHERILYEELKHKGEAVSQQLLVPVTVNLTREEHLLILENINMIKSLGFVVEDFGGTTVIVRSSALYLDGGDIEGVICEIAGCLAANKKDKTPKLLDELYHSVACRAAIKGGEKTGVIEAERLVRRILTFGDIRYCPHGRPVAMVLRRSEIEKQFGRI